MGREEYVVHRDTPGEVSPAGTIRPTIRRVKGRTRDWVGPFTIGVRGGPQVAKRHNKREALKLYKKKLEASDVGDKVFIASPGARVLVTRKITKPVALPEQAYRWPEIQKRIYQFVVANFPGVRYAGTCVCRETRQGGSLSDHACCQASDFFPTSKAQGDEIYRRVMAEFKSAINYISWQVALHYDHLHISTGRCSSCT